MTDRGFTIQNELAPLNAELSIPSFLGGRSQLTEAVVKESQTIHAERAITRIKKFKALNYIPLTLHGFVNLIWTVSCILSNFLPGIIMQKSVIKILTKSLKITCERVNF